MKYIPDTCKNDTRVDDELYSILQIQYRNGFIKYLSKYINFDEINDMINELDNIPVVNDMHYNFYHMNSLLDNKYLYLRNNIHIEKLSDDDLNLLDNIDFLDTVSDDYFKRTYESVLFEDGENISYEEYPNETNIKKSKSIVFEFAYDQKKCESIEQLKNIRKLIDMIFRKIQVALEKENINCDFLVYNAIPEIFSLEELEKENIHK